MDVSVCLCAPVDGGGRAALHAGQVSVPVLRPAGAGHGRGRRHGDYPPGEPRSAAEGVCTGETQGGGGRGRVVTCGAIESSYLHSVRIPSRPWQGASSVPSAGERRC